MQFLLEGLLVFIILSSIVSVVVFISALNENMIYYGCPTYIYDHSNFNIFGTILLFLFFLILVPVYYLMWFVYWICHVGRSVD